jgi:hypothetical protein
MVAGYFILIHAASIPEHPMHSQRKS